MTAGLDDALQTTNRLRIVAFLSSCEEAEFKAVQEHCGLSQSNLSKTVSSLESVGYVAVRKGHVGKRPRTWLALTDEGRKGLAGHLAALQEIVDTVARRA
ncbi:transcriptional regulator [Streptomyces sp. NPDC004069]